MTPRHPLSGRLVAIFAASCGLSVANLYYAQPLLHTIAGALHCGSGEAGLVVTASQIGYAVGLAFLVPVGDIISRKRVTPAVLLITAAAMTASALAPGITVLIAVAVVVGLGSVAAQILIPFAASLADDDDRGRVVGTVMSGLLLGVLLARTLAGLVAGAAGWRVVYAAGAGLMVLLAGALALSLPPEQPRSTLPYPQLLRSSLTLWAQEPILRRRGYLGGLGFAAFSVFWTTIAFLLAGPPYHYGTIVIGLFGLVGAAGALCASFAGRLADRGWSRPATAVFVVLVAVSFLPIWVGRHDLAALIVGIVVLDIGVQGLQVTNQSLIYRLPPETRSRVTSVYMVMYFAGGAVGSAVGGTVYDRDGWAGICVVGAAIGVVAFAVWAWDALRPTASDVGAGGPERAPSAQNLQGARYRRAGDHQAARGLVDRHRVGLAHRRIGGPGGDPGALQVQADQLIRSRQRHPQGGPPGVVGHPVRLGAHRDGGHLPGPGVGEAKAEHGPAIGVDHPEQATGAGHRMRGPGPAVGGADEGPVRGVLAEAPAPDPVDDDPVAGGVLRHAAGLEGGGNHAGDLAVADDVDGVGQLIGDEELVGADGDGVVGLAPHRHRRHDVPRCRVDLHETVVGLLGDEERPLRPAEGQMPGRPGQRGGPLLVGPAQRKRDQTVGVADVDPRRCPRR